MRPARDRHRFFTRWDEWASASIAALVIHRHPEVVFVRCGLARESNVLNVDVTQFLEHVGDSPEKRGYVTLTWT